uniref:THAP4-like heme-binding domain-containing protein n=1 Tax=Hemiselmis andersenii TaxID=464988 RepID=A0A7S1GWS9_HEMAN|mmetsp:Transcript_23287/g.56537  ORF Transcript_23287/g.56537 Transcript_23287/m.56537 type:complete len:160 (+) Transcript_23287:57-536(+)
MADQLQWIAGTFKGDGCGTYPTIKTPFEYEEEVSFEQVPGKPIFFYRQKTWKKGDPKVAMHAESGYLRVGPPAGGPGKAQCVISQITGLTEVCEGTADGELVHVTSKALGRVSTAKDPAVAEIVREIRKTDAGIRYKVSMGTSTHSEVVTHLEATLVRQ